MNSKHLAPAAESEERMQGVTIVKPIIYGNEATLLPEGREDGHTNKWTVYVKPFKDEDMASYVKKVSFKLHRSFARSYRVRSKPPYQVTETGWGEFEVIIKIHFRDTRERPAALCHMVTFVDSGPGSEMEERMRVTEHYDELVFQAPFLSMYHLLTTHQPSTAPWGSYAADLDAVATETLEKILKAKAEVKEEIDALKEQLKLTKVTIANHQAEIEASKVEEPPQ